MAYELLNIPALVAPISEAEPAGEPSVFETLDKLRADRRAIISSMGEDTSPRDGEWNRIVELASDTLQNRSKHLQVSVRLVEAVTRRDGFGGLRDGLSFLSQLADQCWDRMYPELDPSDPSVRADPFEYLNDLNGGAMLPTYLKMIPVAFSEDGEFSWADINAKPPGGDDKKLVDAFAERDRKIKKAIELTPKKNIENATKALKESLSALELLVKVLNDKIGRNDAPGMTNLRESINDCHRQVMAILKDKGGPTPEPGPEEPAAVEGDEEQADGQEQAAYVPVKKATITRADVYQRLAESADLLEKMEPHSPIPYLIKRAVNLGSLPFPMLMKALITDAKAIEELHKGLGIQEEPKK